MKLNYIPVLAAAALALAVTGCSDSDKWEPGPEVAPEVMTVFFPEQTYSYVIQADDSRYLPVTLTRVNYDQAASVALTANVAGEGIVVPATAEFEAGEKCTTVMIDCSSMANKTTGTVNISLPGNVTSPYGAGSTSITLEINVTGAWVLVDDAMTVNFNDGHESITGSIYILDGTERFRFTNFLNSGVDIDFTLGDQNETYPLFIPEKGVKWFAEIYPDEEDENTGWYVYDAATATFPEWSPDGSDKVYSSLQFVGDDYSYFQYVNGYGSLAAYAYYSDGSEGWVFVDFYFNVPDDLNPYLSK